MKIIEKRYYHIMGEMKAGDTGIGHATGNYIRADVYYHEGGYGIMTYKYTPRAYYMSVHKVGYVRDACGTWESTQIFGNDGAKMKLKEVSRQSKKAEAEALAYYRENINRYLNQVYPELELELEDTVTA